MTTVQLNFDSAFPTDAIITWADNNENSVSWQIVRQYNSTDTNGSTLINVSLPSGVSGDTITIAGFYGDNMIITVTDPNSTDIEFPYTSSTNTFYIMYSSVGAGAGDGHTANTDENGSSGEPGGATTQYMIDLQRDIHTSVTYGYPQTLVRTTSTLVTTTEIVLAISATANNGYHLVAPSYISGLASIDENHWTFTFDPNNNAMDTPSLSFTSVPAIVITASGPGTIYFNTLHDGNNEEDGSVDSGKTIKISPLYNSGTINLAVDQTYTIIGWDQEVAFSSSFSYDISSEPLFITIYTDVSGSGSGSGSSDSSYDSNLVITVSVTGPGTIFYFTDMSTNRVDVSAGRPSVISSSATYLDLSETDAYSIMSWSVNGVEQTGLHYSRTDISASIVVVTANPAVATAHTNTAAIFNTYMTDKTNNPTGALSNAVAAINAAVERDLSSNNTFAALFSIGQTVSTNIFTVAANSTLAGRYVEFTDVQKAAIVATMPAGSLPITGKLIGVIPSAAGKLSLPASPTTSGSGPPPSPPSLAFGIDLTSTTKYTFDSKYSSEYYLFTNSDGKNLYFHNPANYTNNTFSPLNITDGPLVIGQNITVASADGSAFTTFNIADIDTTVNTTSYTIKVNGLGSLTYADGTTGTITSGNYVQYTTTTNSLVLNAAPGYIISNISATPSQTGLPSHSMSATIVTPNSAVIYIVTLVASAGSGISCFLKNAPVLTPSGYKRMDSLKIGDLVSTPEGTAVPIQAVNVERVAAGKADPYVIPAGLYGAIKKLRISPDHRILTENGLVAARYLGLKQEAQSTAFDYYNLELPKWANMIVAGVTVESMAPVKRVTVTMAEFTSLMTKRYGSKAMSNEVLTKIMAKCRFLTDGRIEIPIMEKSLIAKA